MNYQTDMISGPRVEVSGWDANEDFFVEKTYFNSEGEGEKEITLRNLLREGCVLFIRVLEPMATGNNFPVPYQAVHVKGKGVDGRAHIGLERLHPRAARSQTSLPVPQATVKVA